MARDSFSRKVRMYCFKKGLKRPQESTYYLMNLHDTTIDTMCNLWQKYKCNREKGNLDRLNLGLKLCRYTKGS